MGWSRWREEKHLRRVRFSMKYLIESAIPFFSSRQGTRFSSSPVLGWASAVLAVLVAYIRAIAASVGAGQIFLGPMAKQQRMAVLTFVSGAAMLTPSSWQKFALTQDIAIGLMEISLAVISIGCVITIVRRLLVAANYLKTIARSK